jgi:hypothetical protein
MSSPSADVLSPYNGSVFANVAAYSIGLAPIFAGKRPSGIVPLARWHKMSNNRIACE